MHLGLMWAKSKVPFLHSHLVELFDITKMFKRTTSAYPLFNAFCPKYKMLKSQLVNIQLRAKQTTPLLNKYY